jgi:hypothetical protein
VPRDRQKPQRQARGERQIYLMATKRVRMDRRLPVAQGARTVTFRDSWGEIRKHYDLTKLSLAADITSLLSAAFAGHHAASEAESLRHCWHALKAFARFVADMAGCVPRRI